MELAHRKHRRKGRELFAPREKRVNAPACQILESSRGLCVDKDFTRYVLGGDVKTCAWKSSQAGGDKRFEFLILNTSFIVLMEKIHIWYFLHRYLRPLLAPYTVLGSEFRSSCLWCKQALCLKAISPISSYRLYLITVSGILGVIAILPNIWDWFNHIMSWSLCMPSPLSLNTWFSSVF